MKCLLDKLNIILILMMFFFPQSRPNTDISDVKNFVNKRKYFYTSTHCASVSIRENNMYLGKRSISLCNVLSVGKHF